METKRCISKQCIHRTAFAMSLIIQLLKLRKHFSISTYFMYSRSVSSADSSSYSLTIFYSPMLVALSKDPLFYICS